MAIYILEFSEPLGSNRHSARFYLGYCEDDRLQMRLKEHYMGAGAKITRAAVQRGFGLRLVATFPGDRELERKLKRQKNTPRIVQRLKKAGVSNGTF